jgi:hypothetical protein
MFSRIMASCVLVILSASGVAHAGNSCCQTNCPTGCPSCCPQACCATKCVTQPACPCNSCNSCVANCGQCSVGNCSAGGCCSNSCCGQPAAACETNVDAAPASAHVAPRVEDNPRPKQVASTSRAPQKMAAKPRQVSRRSAAPASKKALATVVAKPKSVEVEAAKPDLNVLQPINAAQLSLPPLGAPIPEVQAGVVDPSEPEILYVTPTGATDAINPRPAPVAAPKKPAQLQKRASRYAAHGAYQGPSTAVAPLSEITPSRDPAPAPAAPDRTPIRGK